MNQLKELINDLELSKLVVDRKQGLLVDKDFFAKMFEIDTSIEELSFLKEIRYLGHMEMLEVASRMSYLEPENICRNISIVDMAEAVSRNKEIRFLIWSVRLSVAKNFDDNLPNEFSIHRLFESNYKRIFGEKVNIVRRKNDSKNIPDFWLNDGRVDIPVEIKLGSFNENHLKQLRRYMNFYKCEKGVAVAKGLNCAIPDDVVFINYETLTSNN